jgi:hypothetical protein
VQVLRTGSLISIKDGKAPKVTPKPPPSVDPLPGWAAHPI